MATFIWPTTTKRVTSGFRTPSRPNHHGIDIAESGYHPIYASASGTVARSYNSTSYGQCIMIVHNVNGQTWETVYAHMRDGSRRVSEGQTVRQGQIIGVMGNTGQSYGQHLHFELHKGRWNSNKSNAVNPINYLDKEDNKMRYRLRTGKFNYAEDLVKAKADIKKEQKWALYEVPESLDWNPGYRIITAAFDSKKEAENARVKLRRIIPDYAVYIIEA
ncbi:peptidoglycan DD-metalloendopeptidase family protein [Amphibacillus sediminis]|uniref:peptidoglycan DD-metalloendopeptidase family protein n=1 Tax=Amphibacillus sediminis TaxID=360185 RepID=UPI0009FB5010|nr:peptidoglycan DD-metalloendopeptidase family protein [Amphibacillus sediminis]